MFQVQGCTLRPESPWQEGEDQRGQQRPGLPRRADSRLAAREVHAPASQPEHQPEDMADLRSQERVAEHRRESKSHESCCGPRDGGRVPEARGPDDPSSGAPQQPCEGGKPRHPKLREDLKSIVVGILARVEMRPGEEGAGRFVEAANPHAEKRMLRKQIETHARHLEPDLYGNRGGRSDDTIREQRNEGSREHQDQHERRDRPNDPPSSGVHAGQRGEQRYDENGSDRCP